MKKKSYFTEFILSVICSLIFIGFSIFLLVNNHELKQQTSVDNVSNITTKNKNKNESFAAEQKLIDQFVKGYFNYSVDNYKKRLPVLKDLTIDSYYQTLVSSFNDMFIEKGFKSELNNYKLFYSEEDPSTLFIKLNITYSSEGKSQVENQVAVIDVDFISNQPFVSGMKFIQRTEF